MPVIEMPVAARRASTRTVSVRRLSSVDAALDAVAATADRGGCCVYIRNTVSDAVSAWRDLRARGYEPILFHARFAMCDRLAIEQRVLTIFGKDSTPDRRRGQILISTQVVEQSLDLDFDLVVTDLCPIDLLVQRAGRLQRHQREVRPIDTCEMLIVSPEARSDADDKWFARMFRAASFVYPSAALLWLSAKTIFDAGKISTPDGVRPMVEAVYGADAADRLPAGLRDDLARAEDRAFGQVSQADDNLLRVGDGYLPGHQGWASHVHTPTRLGEPTRGIRLATWDGSTLTPYAPGRGLTAWLLSEVSIARRKCAARLPYEDDALEAAAHALETEWDDGSVVMVIEGGTGEMDVEARDRVVVLRYDATTGLS